MKITEAELIDIENKVLVRWQRANDEDDNFGIPENRIVTIPENRIVTILERLIAMARERNRDET